MSEKFFITMPAGNSRIIYFPHDCIAALEELGNVKWNPYDRKLTEEELREFASDSTILLTHWRTPQIGKLFLDAAPQLKMIAHCAGTVAHIASEESYRRGIPCLSANPVMAKYVAEDVLGLMISSMRGYKENDLLLQNGVWRQDVQSSSLFNSTVGLIGLGTVGRFLLDLLSPFHTQVKVYDPYLPEGALDKWKFASAASFDQVLRCDVISVHASQTPETYHLINKECLAKMKDHAVFINTSRGSLVDTAAAANALRSRKLRAAFDVFETEACPQPLLSGMDNVLLQAHLASRPATANMTREIIRNIKCFLNGEAVELAVSFEQFSRMTQE